MRPSEYMELAKDMDEDTPILVSERNEGFDIKVDIKLLVENILLLFLA